jgi:hypothetical protein
MQIVMTTFKLKGIEYYATDCESVAHAMLVFRTNSIGVTIDDIEPYNGTIPSDAKVFSWF